MLAYFKDTSAKILRVQISKCTDAIPQATPQASPRKRPLVAEPRGGPLTTAQSAAPAAPKQRQKCMRQRKRYTHTPSRAVDTPTARFRAASAFAYTGWGCPTTGQPRAAAPSPRRRRRATLTRVVAIPRATRRVPAAQAAARGVQGRRRRRAEPHRGAAAGARARAQGEEAADGQGPRQQDGRGRGAPPARARGHQVQGRAVLAARAGAPPDRRPRRGEGLAQVGAAAAAGPFFNLLLLPYYAHLCDSASAIAASFEQSTGDGDRASLQSNGDGDRASLEQSTGDGSPPQNGHVTIATTSFAHASQTRALQHGSSSASSRNGSWQTPHTGGGIVAPGGGAGVVAGAGGTGVVAGGGAGAITWSPGGGAIGGAGGGAVSGAGRCRGGGAGVVAGAGRANSPRHRTRPRAKSNRRSRADPPSCSYSMTVRAALYKKVRAAVGRRQWSLDVVLVRLGGHI